MVEKYKFVELMRIAAYILFFLVSLGMSAQQEKVYLMEGNLAYENEEYVRADSLYSKALECQENYRLAMYNKGLALYKMGEFIQSSEIFDQIINATTDSLTSNSYFNQANSFLKIWFLEDRLLEDVSQKLLEAEISEEDDIELKMDKYLRKDSLITLQKQLIISKEKHLNLALEGYKSTLRINQTDNDARYNLVYTLKLFPIIEEEKKKQVQENKSDSKKQEQEKPSEFEVETYKKVVDLISNHNFKEAYLQLSDGIEKEPALQKHNKLLQKLEIITKIIDK